MYEAYEHPTRIPQLKGELFTTFLKSCEAKILFEGIREKNTQRIEKILMRLWQHPKISDALFYGPSNDVVSHMKKDAFAVKLFIKDNSKDRFLRQKLGSFYPKHFFSNTWLLKRSSFGFSPPLVEDLLLSRNFDRDKQLKILIPKRTRLLIKKFPELANGIMLKQTLEKLFSMLDLEIEKTRLKDCMIFINAALEREPGYYKNITDLLCLWTKDQESLLKCLHSLGYLKSILVWFPDKDVLKKLKSNLKIELNEEVVSEGFSNKY